MATIGEGFFGAARGYSNVLYISVGVGVGGGIISSGRLNGGATGFASEFGHMTMDPDGALCNCGNRGCWETQVSQRALFRGVCALLAAGTDSMLAADQDHLTVARITAAARHGDTVALTALHQVGRHLGIGIASLVNAFSPELIVLGGILSLAGDFLLPEIDAELEGERHALHGTAKQRASPSRSITVGAAPRAWAGERRPGPPAPPHTRHVDASDRPQRAQSESFVAVRVEPRAAHSSPCT